MSETIRHTHVRLNSNLWSNANRLYRSLHLAHEIRFERTRRIVPFQSFSIPIPQLHTVLFLSILVPEIIRLSRIPILKSYRSSCRHPKERTLLGQIGTRRPKMLMSETYNKLNLSISLLQFNSLKKTNKTITCY